MAEQKKTNEALNVEDALTQSEAFLIKNKKTIIGAILAYLHCILKDNAKQNKSMVLEYKIKKDAAKFR